MRKDLAVIIINPKNEVLLIKYDGSLGHYAFRWGLLEGKIKESESPMPVIASLLWERLKLSDDQIVSIESQPIEINHISHDLEQWVMIVQVNFDDESIWGNTMGGRVRFFSQLEFEAAENSSDADFHVLPVTKEILTHYFDSSK